jgi:hypothetical protein
MTGKVENFKFREKSPTFEPRFNPICQPLLSGDEEKYTKTSFLPKKPPSKNDQKKFN